MIEFAGLDVNPRSSLQDIYDAARAKLKSSSKVNDFIKHKLIGCDATWQEIIPEMLWKTVYTTNVDDVLHSAIKKSGLPVQNFVFIGHRDYFRSSPLDIDDTFVVHLHGSVRKADQGFIFGAVDYAEAEQAKLSWHMKFAEDYLRGNVLFVGTSFNESDLNLYIQYRKRISPRTANFAPNCYFVSTTIDDISRSKAYPNGVLCIKSKAEDFFKWLHSEIIEKNRRSNILSQRLPKIARYTSEASKKAWIVFRNQFNILIDEQCQPPDPSVHDFYGGDSPLWWDINNNNDARFSVSEELINSIESRLVTILTGAAGCGKTTVLMRTAYDILRRSQFVYYYQDESHIDIESLYLVLKSIKGSDCYIFIDNAAEYVDQVDRVIKKISGDKNCAGVRFILSERENRLDRVLTGLSSADYGILEMNWLNDDDIDRSFAATA